MTLKGAWTALITPFKNDSVDYNGLCRNIEYQIENNIDGLLFLGTTAETPTLTDEEKKKILAEGIKCATGRVSIMVGTGTNNTATTIKNTKMASDMGAEYALVVTPYYNKPTQTGIIKHFEEISKNVDIPVVVYNIKGRTGVNIETETLKIISQIPGIAGVKEASGDVGQMGDVIYQIKNKNENFAVLSGDDGLTLPLMSLGGDGVISVVANLIPKEVSALVHYALKGDFESARKMHYKLLPFFKGAFIETNPMPVKKSMEMWNMPAGNCRLPLCDMEEKNVEKLKKILEGLR